MQSHDEGNESPELDTSNDEETPMPVKELNLRTTLLLMLNATPAFVRRVQLARASGRLKSMVMKHTPLHRLFETIVDAEHVASAPTQRSQEPVEPNDQVVHAQVGCRVLEEEIKKKGGPFNTADSFKNGTLTACFDQIRVYLGIYTKETTFNALKHHEKCLESYKQRRLRLQSRHRGQRNMRDTAGAVVVEEEIEQDSGLKVQVALSSLATQDIFSLLSAVSAVFLLHLVCVSVSRRWRTNPVSSVFLCAPVSPQTTKHCSLHCVCSHCTGAFH